MIDAVEAIESKNMDADVSLREILLNWLQTGSERTWRALADALGHKLVQKENMKRSILARLSSTGTLPCTRESNSSKNTNNYLRKY